MMKSFIHKTNRSITSIVFLVVFLCSSFVFQIYPTKAEDPHTETVWVLTETLVNPNGGQLEFYGGGATPGWFGEARFEGTFVKYGVSETSFRIDDRFVDHEYEHHNVTIETFFEKPPLQMTSGETVELSYGFSHSGMAEDGGTRVQFWYDSEDVDIQPETVFAYAPWADNFDGIATGEYSFKVPPAASGSEIEIYASWWNAEPCLVIWKYQAKEVNGTSIDDSAANDLVREDVAKGRELGDAECARLQQEVADKVGNARGANESYLELGIIGVVVGQYGDTIHDYCSGGEGPLLRGGLIKMGDCIRTGPNGRLRIQMNDRDDRRNAGPSVLNIGANSEACFDKFFVNFDDPPEQETILSVIQGAIRVIFKGWRGKSSFKVRAGVSICGIRGSEVLIAYVPEYNDSDMDVVTAQVLEGHMDVTSGIGETVSLYDNQQVIIYGEKMTDVRSLDQEKWDSHLEFYGVSDASFPDVEIEEWEIIAEDVPEDGNGEEEITIAQETLPPLAGYICILGSVLICGAAIVAMLTFVYFARKRSEQ